MAVDETSEHVGEVGVRIDAVQLAALDQRGEDGPVLGTLVRHDVMMPGVWDARSRLATPSIRFRAEARWSSPIRSMMAVAI